MLKEIVTILKHGSIYTLGIAVNRVVSLLMMPVYTHYFSPAEYGTLDLLSLTIDVIATVTGFGMSAAVMRFYHTYADQDKKNRVFSTALLGSTGLMLIVSAICLILAPQFSQMVFASDKYSTHFQIMFASMFFNTSIAMSLIYLRAKLQSARYVVISMIKLVLQLSLNITFLVGMGYGVLGVLTSTLISNIVMAMYLTWTISREMKFRFDLNNFKEMLVFGSPLIVANISIFLLTYVDRYFLNHYCDLSAVGIYSLAYSFGMLLAAFCNSPFSAVWSTEMYRIAQQERGKEVIARVWSYYLIVALTMSLGLSVLTRDILHLMAGESFWVAYQIVPMISFTYVIAGSMNVVGVGMLFANKTKYKAATTAIAVVLQVIMLFLFVPKWGGIGAGLATVVSYILRAIIEIYASQKAFHISYEWGRVSVLLIIYALLLIIGFSIDIQNLLVSTYVKLLIVMAFPLAVYGLGVLSAEERNYVRQLLRNPVKFLRGAQAGR